MDRIVTTPELRLETLVRDATAATDAKNRRGGFHPALLDSPAQRACLARFLGQPSAPCHCVEARRLM